MKDELIIENVEVYQYEWKLKDVGVDVTGSIGMYNPGEELIRTNGALRIITNKGIVGEFAGWPFLEAIMLPNIGQYLIGKNPLERERIYRDTKIFSRQYGRVGIGIIDIALWDIAGKYYNAPIYELLGGFKKKLPAYPSTINGAVKGELSTAESFADFAEQCLDLGFPAFKIHPWPGRPIEEHIKLIHAVKDRVGNKMDLMLDPFCYYNTFGEALKVGKACDECGFFWLEDPYVDGGVSHFGHRKLRQLIKTPLLQGEHIRGVEAHTDLILADATDFIRGDVIYDGITATMKIAHAAESLGIDIELHSMGPAQRHCMASIQNTNYYEIPWVHPKMPLGGHTPLIYHCDYEDGLHSIDKQGNVPVPEGPGLGVEYDWDFIKKAKIYSMKY